MYRAALFVLVNLQILTINNNLLLVEVGIGGALLKMLNTVHFNASVFQNNENLVTSRVVYMPVTALALYCLIGIDAVV